MKTSVCLAILIFLIFLCCPIDADPIKPVNPPSGLERITSIVEKGIADGIYPGAVAVIGQPGRVLMAQAYGRHTYDDEVPKMTLDAVFDLASVSKVAGTATAAMLAIEDGKIRWDDPVSKYIPGFEANGKESVTILHLLTHSSGLKAYESRNVVEPKRLPDESPADALMRHYAELGLTFDAGTGIRYSCLNMQVMARVVENVYGERLEDLLVRRVYGPLGMDNTRYLLSPEQLDRCVPTLRRSNGSLYKGEIHDPLANYHGAEEHCPGNAGLFSTGPDLARLCEMVLSEGRLGDVQVFRPGTIWRMTAHLSPHTANSKRALGWGIYESSSYSTPLNNSDATRVLGHTGYTGTFLWLDKRTRTYVVLLTNRTFPNDASAGEGSPTVGTVQRDVVRTVLNWLQTQETAN